MRLLLADVFMLLFSFCMFSDRRSLKIENYNNKVETLTAEFSYIGLDSLEFYNKETYLGWLEQPVAETNLYGPKPIRATEVLLHI